MDWSSQATIFISMPIIFFFCFILFLRFNRSRVVPVQWPVVGMLPSPLANLDRMYEYATSLLRATDGTFMFKGPWLMGVDFLLTCDTANGKHIFTSHLSDYLKGHDFPEVFAILGNGIITADGEHWSKQRKMANGLISSTIFRSAIAKNCRDKVERAVLPLLERLADLDWVFDLQDFMKRYTMDLVSNLVLGKDPCSLVEHFPMVPFIMAIADVEEALFYRHIVPRLWWKLCSWLDIGEEKKMRIATNVIDRFIAQCIEEKRRYMENKERAQVEEESKDILTSYIYYTLDAKEEDRYFSSDRFIRDTLMTLLAAGMDSSAAALSWFFWEVSKSPAVEKKILNELRQLRSTVDAHDKMVVFGVDQTEGLVYLHAALCETLRLYPSFPFNHKTADKEDVLPSGDRVRAGTMVLFSIYSTGRMERIWGKDCLVFKPERWIDSTSGQVKHMSSHDFLAFHTGPRTCIGKNMAMTQMKVIAAAMVYNFKVEVVKGCAVEPKNAMVLLMKNGLHVRVRKREEPY